MITLEQQAMPKALLQEAKKFRLKKLEEEFSKSLIGIQDGDMIVCPVCNYEGKKGKGTCRVHEDSRGLTIKCFACGIWKRV